MLTNARGKATAAVLNQSPHMAWEAHPAATRLVPSTAEATPFHAQPGVALSNPQSSPRLAPSPAGRMQPPVRAAIDKCMAGDEVACEEFYASYDTLAGRVLRHKFPRMTSADRADIASTALERLLIALKSNRINGTSDGELRAYMSNAVKNAGLDLVTRKRLVGPGWPSAESTLQPDNSASPERVAIARALAEEVRRVLSQWPAADRYIFAQKLHGVSSAQIRAGLERSPFCLCLEVPTIDTRYWRLRHLLMRELGEYRASQKANPYTPSRGR